ncbi:MAG TPA: hypothetical protein VKR31_14355 [Rhizomicrobium sp.]|nr:hypothetical protein [Rhizomicrobium sp.]
MSAGRRIQPSRLGYRLAILPLLLGAAGCAHDKAVPATAPDRNNTAQTAPLAATPNLSPKDRLDLAVGLLQNGDAARAKVELETYLDDVPDSRAAKLLLEEIDTPIAQLYPKQNFAVTLGRHETLSGVAASYLGDPLAFYGLARYNNIAQPGMVIAGQEIRIPATPEALAAQNGFLRAQTLATTGQQPTTNGTGDEATPGKALPAALPPVAGAKHSPADPWAEFRSALSARRYSDAARLADANAFDPRNGRAVIIADAYMRAAELEKQANAADACAHARKAGTIFLGALKQPDKARKLFQLALTCDPSDAVAGAGLKQANAETAEQYYRRGMIAFQHQDLDGAIAAWNVVISINPHYRDAELNRDEAIQLKANLLKLKG